MTGSEVARVFHARRSGRGKWMAKCPAHPDRSPSLSIREGNRCVLVHCFTGCITEAVLAAVGLGMADMFYDAMPDKEALRKAEAKRREEEREHRKRRREERDMTDKARKWQRVAWHLGEVLAKRPEDARLVHLFHRSLDISRKCQMAAHFPYIEDCCRGSLREIRVSDVGPTVARYLGVTNG